MEDDSFKTKLEQKQEIVKKQKNVQKSYRSEKDRDSRSE